MRNNLSHFYFKYLHIKTELFILMYSPIELKLSIKLPDGRRSLSNEKTNCHYYYFFLDGLTLELQATILKTGSCVNIRSKEEFQEKNLRNFCILFKRRNKL